MIAFIAFILSISSAPHHRAPLQRSKSTFSFSKVSRDLLLWCGLKGRNHVGSNNFTAACIKSGLRLDHMTHCHDNSNSVPQMCDSGPLVRCGTVMQWRMSSWARWCCLGCRRTPPTHRSFSSGKEDGTQLTRCLETSPWRSSRRLSWPPYDLCGETDWGASSSNRCSLSWLHQWEKGKVIRDGLNVNTLLNCIFIPPTMFYTELLHKTSKMQKKK